MKSDSTPLSPRSEAPDFALRWTVSLQELRGRPVILDNGAPYDDSCDNESLLRALEQAAS